MRFIYIIGRNYARHYDILSFLPPICTTKTCLFELMILYVYIYKCTTYVLHPPGPILLFLTGFFPLGLITVCKKMHAAFIFQTISDSCIENALPYLARYLYGF